MDRSDLFNLLNLKPKAVAKTEAEPLAEAVGSYSETVLVLDEWDIEQGELLFAEHPEPVLHPIDWADLFACLFLEQPTLAGPCVNERRQGFIETLLASSDFALIRDKTHLSIDASEFAVMDIATEYAKLIADDLAKKPNSKGRLLLAAGLAAKKIGQKLDEIDDFVSAMGIGGHGGFDGTMNLEKVQKNFEKVKNSPRLRRILDLAGRYRRVAQGKQRQKLTHGYDDMVGITLDDQIERLIDDEMMGLCDDEMGDATMMRLLDRETLAYDYRGVEKIGKGPIIVCVDESGSMDGSPVSNAKAFALAMAWIARHQNRYCCLIGYAGGTVGTRCVLKPKKWDEEALMTWLEHFYSGGTTMDVPLAELPTTYWPEIGAPKGKTDLIIITDGQVYVPHEMEQKFNAWKAEHKVRCISLILAHHAGGLSKVSDEVHLIPYIGVDVTAIEGCLSV